MDFEYDEKSCGAVTYTIRNGQPLYLLVKNRSGFSGFPKGHVENEETEPETALREIREETGVNVVLDTTFRREFFYKLSNGRRKMAVYFIATFGNDVPQALDEIDRIWLVPFDRALKVLHYPADLTLLRAAHTYIRQRMHH